MNKQKLAADIVSQLKELDIGQKKEILKIILQNEPDKVIEKSDGCRVFACSLSDATLVLIKNKLEQYY
jgi:hypothetical protein